MTAETLLISIPLAATSVATRMSSLPALNFSIILLRFAWVISPWIAVARYPRALRVDATSSDFLLVLQNTMLDFGL